MMKARLFSLALLSLVACGDTSPEPHTARALWGTLTSSHVARPFALDELASSEANVSPRCSGGGGATAELWHTAYTVGNQGEASGTADYLLDGCRAPQQALAVHGELRRGFKVRRQTQRGPEDTESALGVSRRDVFFGVLELRNPDGICPVDVTRVYEAGVYTYSGTLCGHDASSLGLAERAGQ